MRLLISRLNCAILWHFVAIFFKRKDLTGFIYLFIKKIKMGKITGIKKCELQSSHD